MSQPSSRTPLSPSVLSQLAKLGGAALLGGSQQTKLAFPKLPPLRDLLTIRPGTRRKGEGPIWVLEDAANNRFLRIGWKEFEMLSRWSLETPERVARAISDDTPLKLTAKDVDMFAQFLLRVHLLKVSGQAYAETLKKHAMIARKHWFPWLVKNYLFLRIPLVRPEAFLRATYHYVSWAWTPQFLSLSVFCMVMGIFLAGRQWESFWTTFAYFFSFQGLLAFGVSILFAKILHELAHAYTAHHYRCRVSTMGIAFLVLWPVLYTDTTDAWKLPTRGKRLAIDGAGVVAELILAGYSILLWSFLPDGVLKSAAFLLGTSTWLVTIAINMNPFLRFDGYYLLSDFLRIPNLQMRSFANARWRLREFLFGFRESIPEIFPSGLHVFLLFYSYGTWIYRFFLFLGIAILVYYLFPKALGVPLFVVEIVYFIARPIYGEMKEWAKRWRKLTLNRNSFTTFGVLLIGLGIFFTPTRDHVLATSVFQAEEVFRVFTEVPGQIVAFDLEKGARVEAEQEILRLASPDISYSIARSQALIDTLNEEIGWLAQGGDAAARALSAMRDLKGEEARLQVLEENYEKLISRSPKDLLVAEIRDDLRLNLWLPARVLIAILINDKGSRIEAYVAEQDLDRISLGAKAKFLPDALELPELMARVVEIGQTDIAHLQDRMVASIYGGGVAVQPDPLNDTLIVERPVYKVILEVEDEGVHPPPSRIRGTAVIDGRSESYAGRFWNNFLGLLIRESGF